VIRLTVLYVGYSVRASYYDDWLQSFQVHPGVLAQSLNLFSPADRRRVADALVTSDLAVILHSGTGDTLDYVRKATPALVQRRCPLVVFMGNEFNIPWLPFADRRAWLKEVGANFVATQLLEATGTWLYEGSGARVISVPHGLNPNAFRITKARRNRPIDIGTRTFPYPIYIGNQLRNTLIQKTRQLGESLGLRLDVRNDIRFARSRWAEFLNQCRFTVATEAGSTSLDRDDSRSFAIQNFLRERRRGLAINPASSIRGVARHLPWGIRQGILQMLARVGVVHEGIEADPALHAEVIERFFSNEAHTGPCGTCISSRHFDAIGCGTVQILVEGHYSDILEAGVHYVPVRSDLDDLEHALRHVANRDFAEHIIEGARRHVMAHHTLEHRISSLLKRVLGV